ncbi:hypothetical protein QWZ03_00805 [Chitinimonas viridis]|uniref:Biotin-protein ligase N-terminal domain-containing protein n=1 Tax=Chitinimonas viridis TaxID=664880 RepID=A0ABT8AZW1_9NEIS|nr:hypothetical protein [Chitinimonas viridis]MDN3575310.1 hypothetical protein [Chitinimonas viridis]
MMLPLSDWREKSQGSGAKMGHYWFYGMVWFGLSACLPLQASGQSVPPRHEGVSTATPVVLIYAGPPVCRDCEMPILQILQQPQTPALKALAPKARVLRSWADIPQALKTLPPRSVLLIPGTDDDLRAWASGPQQMSRPTIVAIQRWLRAGGRYVGICGGAIVAQAEYEDGLSSFKALNIAPITADNFADEDAVERIEKVRWLPTGQIIGAYFQAGSVLQLLPSQERVEVLGHYLPSTGKVAHHGGIAAAQFSYGQGKVFITGVHLEAKHDFWDKPPADFVPHTELLEAVLVDLISQGGAIERGGLNDPD